MQTTDDNKFLITIPNLPDSLESMDATEIKTTLLTLVRAKAQLEEALMEIRASLKKYENVAKDADSAELFNQLKALDKWLDTDAA